jgi:hypothetical protein
MRKLILSDILHSHTASQYGNVLIIRGREWNLTMFSGGEEIVWKSAHLTSWLGLSIRILYESHVPHTISFCDSDMVTVPVVQMRTDLRFQA